MPTGSPVASFLEYKSVRVEFNKWLENRVETNTRKAYISALDRYFGDTTIRSVEDLRRLLDNTKRGKHHLTRALRSLINFYLENDWMTEEFAIKLKRLLNTHDSKPDLYFPTDDEVRGWLEAVSKREDALLTTLLIVFGGIRIREALRILQKFDERRLKTETINGTPIAYYELLWTRKTKNSFVAFMPPYVASLLKPFPRTTYVTLRSYLSKRKGVRLKYARKWFINKMFEARVPESVVKYIVGHSTGSIMSIHYLDLFNQAKREYARSYKYLERSLNPSLSEILEKKVIF
ncbi:integrase [Thermococcus sp.]|uniref:integrase n=1 Tax=Thermococcus sp. TaxID=35749 RepID=UPI00262EF713|nr:integrase [Thermococcus sp.]